MNLFFIFTVTVETIFFIYPGRTNANAQVTCPDPRQIAPCSCQLAVGLHLKCEGETIVQENIDKVVEALGQEKGSLQIQKFDIESTDLTELNLTSLFNLTIETLVISENKLLNKIKSDLMTPGVIHVENLQLRNNPRLDDEGLADALKLFSPVMKQLDLQGNSFRGHLEVDTIEWKFLPGLAQLHNVQQIELSKNKIEQLGVGQFRNNTKLKILSLTDNKISTIRDNFFDFPNSDDNSILVIDLCSNFLTEDSLNAKMFVNKMSRPLNLILNKNQFSTIPAVPFQKFLVTNPTNKLDFKDNLLKCDEKLDWIKSRKEEFNQSRILNADCEGKSIFASKYFKSVVVENVTDSGALTIILSISIPAILILVIIAVVLWFKINKIQKRSSNGGKGNPNLSNQNFQETIRSRPFDNENFQFQQDLLEIDDRYVLDPVKSSVT